jgi:hypothetical protein
VAAAYRDDCVEAINSYRSEHGFVKIAVCSRATEYQALTNKLRLPAAISIMPLSRSEVLKYFDHAGTAMDSMRAAAEADPGLYDLLETPLTLSIASLVAKNLRPGSVEAGPGLSTETRRAQLFAFYIDAMFKRRTKETRYTPDQMRGWLTWLAKALVRREQILFRIEDLRHNWLETRTERLFVSVVIALVVAIVSGLVGAISLKIFGGADSVLYYCYYFVPIGLLMAIVRGRSTEPIDLVEVRWPGLLNLSTAMAGGGALGGALGFVCGFIACNDAGFGGYMGLCGALAFGLGAAMNRLAMARMLEIRPSANFALSQSLRNTIGYVSVSMGFGLTATVAEKTVLSNRVEDFVTYVALGLCLLGWVGLFFAMEKGGYFLLDHYTTRLLLWSRGRVPWNLLVFLDAAVARVLMRRVGAGYIFVHRMLLDHFASAGTNASGNGGRSTGASAGP